MMRGIRGITILLSIIALMGAAEAAVVSLGVRGATYDIAEPDALTEIEERAAEIDPEAVKDELEKKYGDYRPPDLASLPPARSSYSYTVDVSYTLEYDIPRVNDRGEITGILYPTGYRFNPLEYLSAYPPPLVVFNGESRKEVLWVKENRPAGEVLYLATGGDFKELVKEIQAPVFYLKEVMVERLGLKNTISNVYREADRIRVDVHAIPETGR